jgi:hypothetical protein
MARLALALAGSDGRTEQRKQPLTRPPLETPAEREKRWTKHLQAIDARGERYQVTRPGDWRRGYVV